MTFPSYSEVSPEDTVQVRILACSVGIFNSLCILGLCYCSIYSENNSPWTERYSENKTSFAVVLIWITLLCLQVLWPNIYRYLFCFTSWRCPDTICCFCFNKYFLKGTMEAHSLNEWKSWVSHGIKHFCCNGQRVSKTIQTIKTSVFWFTDLPNKLQTLVWETTREDVSSVRSDSVIRKSVKNANIYNIQNSTG